MLHGRARGRGRALGNVLALVVERPARAAHVLGAPRALGWRSSLAARPSPNCRGSPTGGLGRGPCPSGEWALLPTTRAPCPQALFQGPGLWGNAGRVG